jgi:hypothetical protein
MIQVQGSLVLGKSSDVILTSGNPFLPAGINVAGKARAGTAPVPAQWRTLRVFADAKILAVLAERVRSARSLLVRSYVSDRVSTYTAKDGTVQASLSFAADIRRLAIWDNESRQWVPALQFLGVAQPPVSPAEPEPEMEVDDLPF